MKYTAQEITRSLGGRWQGSYGMAPCPCHKDNTASLKISEKQGKNGKRRLDCHCFAGCDWKDIKAELVSKGLVDPWRTSLDMRHELTKQAWAANSLAAGIMHKKAAQNAAADQAKRILAAMDLWGKAVALEGTLGGTYLRVIRGLIFDDGEFDHALRYSKQKICVVGLMTDPVTGEPCGVQRIFLDELGRKVDRKMLGKAGIVRISKDEDVGEGLFITEGIEDAIASWQEDCRPVWACLSAQMMANFPVLNGIEALTILADSDQAGQDAATKCALRWDEADREAKVLRYDERPA